MNPSKWPPRGPPTGFRGALEVLPEAPSCSQNPKKLSQIPKTHPRAPQRSPRPGQCAHPHAAVLVSSFSKAG
eukprot:2166861-Pyramimonas_sp.AAC.1